VKRWVSNLELMCLCVFVCVCACECVCVLKSSVMYISVNMYHLIYMHTYIHTYIHTYRSTSSKGDQAYFFLRQDPVAPFANGSIVWLIDGRLVPDSDPGMYLCLHVCMHVSYSNMCVRVCLYVSTYMCTHVCMYAWICTCGLFIVRGDGVTPLCGS
jgi:hypothetical protein